MSSATEVASEPPTRARSPEPRTRRRRNPGARTGLLFMAPFAILFIVVFVIPIVVAIRSAFFAQVPRNEGLFGGGGVVEQFVGLDNFITAASGTAFWRGMGRVVLYAGIQIPIMIGLALVLALLLDSFLVRRVGFFRLSYFLPYAIPGVIAAMMWLYLYTPSLSPFLPWLPDWVDLMTPGTILFSMANMTTWTYTGYNMLIFLAALQAIPHDLYEAARIDGASGFKIATRIKIPSVRGAALLAVLLSIIGTIQLFNEPVILETVNPWMGKDYTPMMMAYNTMTGTISPSGSGPANAISILMAIIAGVLAVVYASLQRRRD
ncbi:sugar ABC transporter permease [Arthrobacter echini]|uniref:Sugar ABC transporter permease n=1 Tax=Arthrobacter echini TaxID=1529066 RepID=A0A4S5E6Q6_9MICC|nr:sugar ABC transporter permease [Arthrobacter echini]THJ67140.1 sugar ABC transporter permease [Arthrobacter echini]